MAGNRTCVVAGSASGIGAATVLALAHAKNAARKLAAQDLRVNTLSPGATDTPVIAAPLADTAHRQCIEGLAAQRHIGRPEQIATGIAYLLLPVAAFTHGANRVADGGIVI